MSSTWGMPLEGDFDELLLINAVIISTSTRTGISKFLFGSMYGNVHADSSNSGWGDSIGRIPKPDKDIFTLYDYRERHATYRTDLDLLELHANFPWIPVWDDHGMATPKQRYILIVVRPTDLT